VTVTELARRIEADQLAAAAAYLRGRQAEIAQDVRGVLAEDLEGSPEAAALRGGLRPALGLAEPDAAVAAVVAALAASVRVEVAATPAEAALTVLAYKADFADALAAPGSAYPNTGKAGGDIPWLAWLLFGPDGPGGYGGLRAAFGGRGAALLARDGGFTGSRTGPAIMVPLGGKVRRPFDLPSPWAGTPEDNWLTRSAARVGREVAARLERVAAGFRG
jgi:hypothetical protein